MSLHYKKIAIAIISTLLILATTFFLLMKNGKFEKYYNMNIKKYRVVEILDLYYGEDFETAMDKLYIKQDEYVKEFIEKNKKAEIIDGIYRFKGRRFTLKEILSMLKNGEYETGRIIIWKGDTVKSIEDRMIQNKLLKKGELQGILKNTKFPYPTPKGDFQGYFPPGTYKFKYGESGESVVKQILDNFTTLYPPEKYPDKDEFYKNLVLASIIERESIFDDEDKAIASVFYNRLKKEMRLQSDATVNFLHNYEKKRIYYKDLEVDSPYNTYKVKGLPPGPIGNPGKSAMEAAWNPLVSKYLYFVATEKSGGRHLFSENYDEHLKKQE